MVRAPAKTGKESTNKIAVKKTLQMNKGILGHEMALFRRLIMVQRKFREPPILETPATCILKIAKSKPLPGWPVKDERGGYSVHPLPTPLDSNILNTSNPSLNGSNHSERLFIRGNAISLQPSITGISQFLNPPINTGITKKKIMINPWAVITMLYIISLIITLPSIRSSVRINNLRIPPNKPAMIPKTKYIVPMSLWFVLYIHRLLNTSFICLIIYITHLDLDLGLDFGFGFGFGFGLHLHPHLHPQSPFE